MTVDREWWINHARGLLAAHDALPAADKTWLPYPARVEIQPAKFLELLGEHAPPIPVYDDGRCVKTPGHAGRCRDRRGGSWGGHCNAVQRAELFPEAS